MGRLTERDEYGNANIIALSDMMPELYAGLSFSETNAMTDALNSLADYEDAEENGTLIKLPCKVGDTVWALLLTDKRIIKGTVSIVSMYIDTDGIHYAIQVNSEARETVVSEDEIFYSREKAEKALADWSWENE